MITRDIEEIKSIAEGVFSSYGIPLVVRQNGRTVSYYKGNNETDKLLREEDRPDNYHILWTEDVIIYVHPAGDITCRFKCGQQKLEVILGPVNIRNVNPLMIFYINESSTENSQVRDLKEFLDLCSLTYRLFAGKDINSSKLQVVEKVLALFSDRFYVQKNSNLIEQSIEQDHREMAIRLELIKHGDVEKIRELNNRKSYIKALLQTCGNEYAAATMLACGLYLSMHYAFLGGVPIERAGEIASNYLSVFRSIGSKEETVTVYNRILEQYAELVTEYRFQNYSAEIVKAIRLIKKNINKKLVIDELAREVGQSTSYFMHKFKSETGITAGEYIRNEKIQYAKLMLAYTDYSLAEISEYLACSTQSYFTTMFRKAVGITPQEYRNQNT